MASSPVPIMSGESLFSVSRRALDRVTGIPETVPSLVLEQFEGVHEMDDCLLHDLNDACVGYILPFESTEANIEQIFQNEDAWEPNPHDTSRPPVRDLMITTILSTEDVGARVSWCQLKDYLDVIRKRHQEYTVLAAKVTKELVARSKRCARCDAKGARAKCGGCLAVRYCSTECGVIHWNEVHKKKCPLTHSRPQSTPAAAEAMSIM